MLMRVRMRCRSYEEACVREVSIVLWRVKYACRTTERERGFFRRAAHSGLVPVVHLAPLRARGPVLILVFVALAVVFVRHIRPVQLLALGPVDPTQPREIERERLVELRLKSGKRPSVRHLHTRPATGKQKSDTHLRHLDLGSWWCCSVYPAFPLVVLRDNRTTVSDNRTSIHAPAQSKVWHIGRRGWKHAPSSAHP